MKKLFAAALCLFIASFFCTACQPAAIENAKEAVNQTSDGGNMLQDQIERLKKENGYLRASNVEMSSQIQSLEEENAELKNSITGTDAVSLLNTVAASDKKLQVFPAYIKEVKPDAKGYRISIDRLKVNPDFEIGGMGEEAYLINEKEQIETFETNGSLILNFDGRSVSEIDPDFAVYVNEQDAPGEAFTLYMLGDEILLIDEILVP